VTTGDLKYHACRLVVKGKTLYIIGNDRHGPQRKKGWWHTGPKGTCKAVTLFLENHLGVRWFAPTPMGVRIPNANDVSVPDDLNTTWKPTFFHVHLHRAYDMDSPGALANNIATSVSVWQHGGHTWNVWVPASKYYEDNPEYFALLDQRLWPLKEGEKRQRPKYDIRGHLCTSNPETQKIMAEKIRQLFDKGFDWVELGQTDGWQPCRCDECEATDNYKHWIPDFKRDRDGWFEHLKKHPCERIFKYHHGITSALAKSHPDKKVVMLGYQATLIPPETIEVSDNVIMEICVSRDVDKVLGPWRGKVSMIHVINNSFYLITKPAGILPKHSPELAKRAIKKMLGYNVHSIYFGGCGEDWALEGIAYYTTCRLLGDPDLDIEIPMREYCDFIYGAASDEMMDFYKTMFQRITDTRESYIEPEGYSYKYVFTRIFSPELVQRLEAQLSAAEKKASTERARGWLSVARLYFNYLTSIVRMLDAYERFAAVENVATLTDLKAAFDAWKAARRDLVKHGTDPEYASKWFPHTTFVLNHGLHLPRGKAGLLYSDPAVALDYKSLFVKYGIADKLGLDSELKAARPDAVPEIDGVIRTGEWNALHTRKIPEINDAGRIIPTSITASYDARNLYFAFVCSEPLRKALVLKEGGSAESVRKSEAVELLIEPKSSKRALYFILSPKDGGFFTSVTEFEKGLRSDVPGNLKRADDIEVAYVTPTRPWQPWVLEVAIPWRLLGADTPRAGDRWRFDAGRRRWANWRKRLNKPYLYRWSYNSLADSPPVLLFE